MKSLQPLIGRQLWVSGTATHKPPIIDPEEGPLLPDWFLSMMSLPDKCQCEALASSPAGV